MRPLTLLPVGLVLIAACSSPPSYGLLEDEPDAERLQRQLRAGTIEISLALTNQIWALAGDLLTDSDDPQVRRAAMVLSLRVGDEAGRALYHQDPVASAVDLSALVLQLQDWLGEGGDGNGLFGADQPRVQATADGFAERLSKLVENSSAAVVRNEVMAQARGWADAHPLVGRYLSRTSVAPLMSQLGSRQGKSVFAMADSVQESVSSIETRLVVMGQRMPIQTVSQAAFLLDAYLERMGVEEPVQRSEVALAQVEELDRTLTREREATLAEIDRQREATLEQAAELTRALGELVTAERLAVLDSLEAMRTEVLENLERQRQESFAQLDVLHESTLEALESQVHELADRLDVALERALGRPLDEQRADTLETAEALSREAVAEVLDGTRELVDLVFLRALVLIVVLGVFGVGAAALLRRRTA